MEMNKIKKTFYNFLLGLFFIFTIYAIMYTSMSLFININIWDTSTWYDYFLKQTSFIKIVLIYGISLIILIIYEIGDCILYSSP